MKTSEKFNLTSTLPPFKSRQKSEAGFLKALDSEAGFLKALDSEAGILKTLDRGSTRSGKKPSPDVPVPKEVLEIAEKSFPDYTFLTISEFCHLSPKGANRVIYKGLNAPLVRQWIRRKYKNGYSVFQNPFPSIPLRKS